MNDWIKWRGGVMPVDGATLVETKWSDGQPCPIKEALKWRWQHVRHSASDTMPMPNLIAYRVVQP